MNEELKKFPKVSSCCHSGIRVCCGEDFGEKDDIRTCWNECVSCNQPCDAVSDEGLEDRPAWLQDEKLKKAAIKAAKVFEEEERFTKNDLGVYKDHASCPKGEQLSGNSGEVEKCEECYHSKGYHFNDNGKINCELCSCQLSQKAKIESEICSYCKKSKAECNPSGYCDHLYYPENCKTCSQKVEVSILEILKKFNIEDTYLELELLRYYEWKISSVVDKERKRAAEIVLNYVLSSDIESDGDTGKSYAAGFKYAQKIFSDQILNSNSEDTKAEVKPQPKESEDEEQTCTYMDIPCTCPIDSQTDNYLYKDTWEEELADYHYEDAGQRIDFVRELKDKWQSEAREEERKRAAEIVKNYRIFEPSVKSPKLFDFYIDKIWNQILNNNSL